MTIPAGRGVPLAVWRTLRRDLPLAVLDRPVDELPPEVVAWTTGGPVPHDAQLGGPTMPSVAPRSPARADLEDDLDALIAAVPAPEPTRARQAATETRKHVSPSDEQLAELMTQLGVGLPAVLDLVDGKRQPNDEEVAALLEVLGVIPEVPTPPAELLIEMYHPRWKVTVLTPLIGEMRKIAGSAMRQAWTDEPATSDSPSTSRRGPSTSAHSSLSRRPTWTL